MIGASTELKTILNEWLAIHATTRVIAEWNMNRFVSVESIGNGSYEDDPLFPIKSIVTPRRPGRGAVKARGTYVSEPSLQEAIGGEASSSYTNAVDEIRYYAASIDDPYKYYTTPVPATDRIVALEYGFTQPQTPYVVYAQDVYCNKLVIGIENSVSSPVDFTIETTVDGTIWESVASSPPIDNNGQVILWLSDSFEWSATPNYDNITQIRGVRVVVNSMDRDNAHFSLIEISPRIENDLSDYVIDWSTNFSMSDTSQLAPMGRASSNTGSITLSNVDGRFNNDNVNSLYYDLIDKNVRFKIDFGIKKANGSYEYVRQGTMYAQSWAPDNSMGVLVSLKDSSSFAQEETVPSTYFEGHTVGAIIWRLVDIMGFTNFNYIATATDSFVVPYFWTEGEESLWEVISKLCEVTQTAVYFDEYDVMQIKTKSAAYDIQRPVDWQLRATDAPGVVANIVELSKTHDFESNAVSIRYRQTGYSDTINGFPQMEVSWEPEGSVVLRAASIVADIVSNSQYIYIPQEKATSWPYAGMINVEAELIRYEGKMYNYYDTNGSLVSVIVNSLDEKNAIDKEKSDPELAWKNYFTGQLKIKKRGENDSPVRDHIVNKKPTFTASDEGYVSVRTPISGWGSDRATGASWNKEGGLRIANDVSYATYNSFHLVENYRNFMQAPARFGTRVKFVENGWPTANNGVASMFFLGGWGECGLYATIHTTALSNYNNRRHQEVSLGIKDRWGTYQTFQIMNAQGDYRDVGYQQEVVPGVWYDLEATVYVSGPDYFVTLYFNGVESGQYMFPTNWLAPSGRFGLCARTHCTVDFEYLYAFGPEPLSSENPDEQTTYLDLIHGDYRSGTVRDFKNSPQGRGIYFFDEFSPIAHEVREYEIKFTETPVLHSYLYFSNDSQVMCTYYSADPFGAKFSITNTSRQDAILVGEDKITFGSDNPVDQKMFVYGRLLKQENSQDINIANEDGIRRRGKSEVTVDSNWIQSNGMAQSLADWIVHNWGTGSDELQIDGFYNPLIQLGDLVTISHIALDMNSASHKYFVTEINRRFAAEDQEYRLTLRRARI